MTGTIAELMIQQSDQDLIDMMPYIRDEDGEKLVSLVQLKHILREEVRRVQEKARAGGGEKCENRS